MRNGISREVEYFISEAIESVEELEILLLLYEDRSRCLTLPEINQQVRSSLNSVEQRIGLLLAHGLIERGGETPPVYRCALRDAAMEARVAALKAAYRDYRTAVIEMIYSGSKSRVLDFARSFQLRSKNEPSLPP